MIRFIKASALALIASASLFSSPAPSNAAVIYNPCNYYPCYDIPNPYIPDPWIGAGVVIISTYVR